METLKVIFFEPVYNILVFFIDVVRSGDLGLAIIFTVIAIKVIFLPLSLKYSRAQHIMREIQPQLDEIKEKYKDPQEQGLKVFELYRKSGLSMGSLFLGFFLLIFQACVFVALYFAVYSGGGVKLPAINQELLYSFIQVPQIVTTNFLGLIDITTKSILFALIAGVTQFLYIRMTLPPLKPRKEGAAPDFKEDFARNMQLQMKYVLPPLIAFLAYTLTAVVALYFIINNLASIVQEFIVRRQNAKPR